ncbi:MAG: DUF92 domain-containing protein [Firmicutes bacterium]|nr:DUF92 domain-containing protein [Bacillota bacterium]
MLPNNPAAFVISLFYFVAVLSTVEVLRHWFKLSPFTGRRLTILGLTHSAFFLPPLFKDWQWFVLAPAVFALLYLTSGGVRGLFHRRASVFGAVYIFLSLILLFYLFWEPKLRPFAVAGLLVLGWGDTLAAAVGRRFGVHKYYIYDEEKSWEGTLAMFVGAWGTLVWTASNQLDLAGDQLIAYVTLTAAFAALLEAISIRRTDNLIVPVGTAFLLFYLVQTNIPSAQITLLITGVIGSFLVAVVAYLLKALDEGGVAGAVLVGTFIYTFGGWNWIPALLIFFTTSSLLTVWSKNKQRAKRETGDTARGIDQVLANGGIGAALAVLSFLNVLEPHLLFVGFLGSIAGVTADTWSTEIGMALEGKPRMIFSRRQVPPGTSGAVSTAGLWGAFAGSLVIALSGLILFVIGGFNWRITLVSTLAVLAAGFLGSVIDSLLGAKLQVTYYCDYCLKETEQRVHTCGCRTRPIKGLTWMDNNLVNFLASLSATAVAMALFGMFA